MEIKLSMTLIQLEDLLRQQRNECAVYMTRNLSVYGWGEEGIKFPEDMRERLEKEARKSPPPNDFNVLSKYLS